MIKDNSPSLGWQVPLT